MNEFEASSNTRSCALVASLASITPAGRRLLLREKGDPRGYFVSVKLNRAMPWWRPLERDYMRLLETDTYVISYDLLQDQVTLAHEGEMRLTYPHFEIRRNSGTTVVDVVSARRGKAPGRLLLTRTLQEAYRARGWTYEVAAEASIYAEPRFGNAIKVLPARRFELLAGDIQTVMLALSAPGPQTVSDLLRESADPGRTRRTLYALALLSKLQLDLTGQDMDSAMVSLSEGDVR